MGSLNRWRQPVAQLALLVGAGYIVLSIVQLVRPVIKGQLTLRSSARVVGGGSLSIPIIIVIVATALACSHLQPRTPQARRILGWAARLVTLGAAMEFVMLVLSLLERHGDGLGAIFELLGGLLSIAIKSAAAAILFLARRTLPADGAEAATPDAPPAESAPSSTSELVPAHEPSGVAASWRPEEAVGSVWTRAGDAATGAAGSSARSGASAGSSGSADWSMGGWNAAPPAAQDSRTAQTTSPWSASAWTAGHQQLPPMDEHSSGELDGPAVPGTGWDPLPKQ